MQVRFDGGKIARSNSAYGKTLLVNQAFDQRLGALRSRSDVAIGSGLRGIEKEALRIDASGYLAQTPHPAGLGSALTNRFITTDFSEALLEFVTPALASTWEAQQAICDIHQFTYQQLGDELLWAASMPCQIAEQAGIPLARYGDSNVGQMKTIYRRGLGHRYGRPMQTIAGVHFNYSLPATLWPGYQEILDNSDDAADFRSTHYLGLVRNFRRFGWLVLYLFGASPALCKSFGGGEELDMPSLNDETYFEPFGTSLRMSDLGYNNQTQASISISLNRLDEYIRDLSAATRTPEPAYEKFGIVVDGEYQQLNTNKLQIENEYYSPVRPKRVARSGERPTAALRRGGIEYVEIRSLDINVFDPAGINQNTMRFMESFLVYCLLEDSPPFDAAAFEEAQLNQALTAKRGREPKLQLQRDGDAVALTVWADEIMQKVSAVAEFIDDEDRDGCYVDAAKLMASMIDEPDNTPSARLLQELREADCSFFEFALEVARGHRAYFRSIAPMPEEQATALKDEARHSLRRQRQIEAADSIDFAEYLACYFASE
jgi:glutamate--cysteine ligase